MSAISAASVNELRKRTDQPLMECKKALTEANGDMDKAIDLLRSWNAKAGVKREANETAEGRVAIAIAGDKAAIVELRCESAPTAKNDRFIELANELAKHVMATQASDVAGLLTEKLGNGTVLDRINEVVGTIREKMVIHRFASVSGGVYGQYVHHDGSVGTLIHCTGKPGSHEALRDICAHVSALNPQFTTPSDVPAEVVEKEKAFIASQIVADPKNASKPANIIEKMSEGKLKTWMGEIVMTEQAMANQGKYPGQTVGQVLTKLGLTPVKVIRYKVGAVGV